METRSSNRGSALSAALCLFTVFGCGPDPQVQLASLTQRSLNGGAPCDADQQPSSVALVAELEIYTDGTKTDKSKDVICGGAVVAPNAVVTAAHCLQEELLTGGWRILVDARFFVSFDRSPLAGELHEVTSFEVHPDFDWRALSATRVDGLGDASDVAVLFFSEPLEVPPALMLDPAQAGLGEGQPVVIAGWGSSDSASADRDAPSSGTKRCAESTITELGDFEMRVGSENAPRKCKGDSGAPTFASSPSGAMFLAGITSHGIENADCTSGAADTRIDVFKTWIEGTIDRLRMNAHRATDEPETSQEAQGCGGGALAFGLFGLLLTRREPLNVMPLDRLCFAVPPSRGKVEDHRSCDAGKSFHR